MVASSCGNQLATGCKHLLPRPEHEQTCSPICLQTFLHLESASLDMRECRYNSAVNHAVKITFIHAAHGPDLKRWYSRLGRRHVFTPHLWHKLVHGCRVQRHRVSAIPAASISGKFQRHEVPRHRGEHHVARLVSNGVLEFIDRVVAGTANGANVGTMACARVR